MLLKGYTGFEWVSDRLIATTPDRKMAKLGDVRDREEGSVTAELCLPDGECIWSGVFRTAGEAKLRMEEAVRSFGGDMPESFPCWVRAQRLKRGMSLYRLGRIAGLDHTTIRSVEMGEHPPRDDTRAKLIGALDGLDQKSEVVAWKRSLEERVADLEEKIERLQKAARLMGGR